MKRSGLKRKAWPKRGGKLRARSKKPSKAKKRREGEARKQAWLATQDQFCWVCGRRAGNGLKICVHHMIQRVSNPDVFDWDCNYFLVCWGPVEHCHDAAFHSSPLAYQLALKYLRDPDNFSREGVMEIRDPRAPEFVTMEEVWAWVEELQSEKTRVLGAE